MSDCCCNPGVGKRPNTWGDPDYEAYRPGEVRLYGRPAICRPIFTINPDELDKLVESEISNKTIAGTDNKEISQSVRRVLERHIRDSIIGAKGENIMLALFDGSEYCSLPVQLNIKDCCCDGDGNYLNSIGVIYGYAYEGHCYKLPKPQIMFLPSHPKNIVKSEHGCECECGYDPALGYAVWQIDKQKAVIALDIRSDNLKTLVLDENIPGNRSPLAYAQSMSLAPQRYRE
ncbi:hypothetical protein [Sinorhizobium fredii]|uniref:Uncharacterized protein n=2 Tax=Rhizobium fredii TaxID=380 RepID=A0A2A6LQC2_RHIFR|nr:hypothetical protein [Sinorhizobium fredii]AWM25560.1 hypothetical protein AOX55_00002309 [Sinorhizobium fredii CCBAU 25509]MCG5475986.1 hypothetical protein [Sinorhizobium fredii]MQW97112.1 hypothetical protein [Sinorhizobium fredii]MQX10233.1 hypothetical protein [Sinorhizobium fredii]PDT44490.1 hypothetical protein CO661_29090 [Sinorhizobium fredii]